MRTKAYCVALCLATVFALASAAFSEEATSQVTNTTVSVTPIATYVLVSGDKAAFRRDTWTKDGWSGGVEDFSLDSKLPDKWNLHADGHAIFNQADYAVHLSIVNPEVGFVRTSYTQFRKYFDDNGGFFAPFSVSSFSLGRDLYMDLGDFSFEAGLTLPDLPKITIGYERKTRDGSKSMVEWGSVAEVVGGVNTTRNIYPAFKSIDETVDIFKFDIEHDVGRVHLADHFRYEHDKDSDTRLDDSSATVTNVVKTVTVTEHFSYDVFFNTFQVDSHLNDKTYVGLGYLFTTLSGNSGITLDTVPFTGGFDKDWSTTAVSFNRDSHVLNLSGSLEPCSNVVLYAGIQAEKTDEDGFTQGEYTSPTASPPFLVFTQRDLKSVDESLGVRFTGIAYTTLYAEAKLGEEQIDLNWNPIADAAGGFDSRNTEIDIFRQNYTIGFNTAPLRWMTLSGKYRHSLTENDYDQDQVLLVSQDFMTDEVSTKLTVRPTSRVSVSFRYQLLATDVKSLAADPATTSKTGNYDASIYTVSATVTPISRLYVTGLFSLQDTRTLSVYNGVKSVTPYHGNVYTVMASAGYAVDEKTDITVQGSYSRADNFENISAFGLPYGLSNERYAATVGLVRRMSKNVQARLDYGYYQLNDSSAGNIDNYRAHLISASCQIKM